MKEHKLKVKDLWEKFFKDKTIREVVGTIEFNKHHNYSFFNQMYVGLQAELRGLDFMNMIKPFNAWKKEDVYVKKGETGLKVLVPLLYRRENEEGEVKQYLKGFSQGTVFDISQTDSEEYEGYKNRKENLIYKNELGLEYDDVKKFVIENFKNGQKLTEDFKDQECKGSYNIKTKEIKIFNKDSQTLLHEFSHSITQDLKDDIKGQYSYNEVIAEITTYLISKKLGSDGYNYTYANIWSSRIGEKDFGDFVKIISKIEKKIKELNFEGQSKKNIRETIRKIRERCYD